MRWKLILMLGCIFSCLVAWSIFSNLSVAQVYAMIEDMEAQSIIDDETMLILRIFFGYALYNGDFLLLSTGLGRFQFNNSNLFFLRGCCILASFVVLSRIYHGFLCLSGGSLSTCSLVQATTSINSAPYVISPYNERREHNISVALVQLTGSVAE